MVNAVVRGGQIRSLEPLPPDWREGQRLRVERADDAEPTAEDTRATAGGRAAPGPNTALLHVMDEIGHIQEGMNPRGGDTGVEYVREARAGAMYGDGPAR